MRHATRWQRLIATRKDRVITRSRDQTNPVARTTPSHLQPTCTILVHTPMSPQNILPISTSPSLGLRTPNDKELKEIWASTATMWADALPPTAYYEEQARLETAPLAKDGGMTHWILVDTGLSAPDRQILSSCETYRKRAFLSDAHGKVKECIVYGVASVLCPEEFRGRGYAVRMLMELSKQLYSRQTADLPCLGSILYSDIGRQYYAKLGWHPNITNSHVELERTSTPWPSTATPLRSNDLVELCRRDEAMLRDTMAATPSDGSIRMAIVPDVEHMLTHHAKEEIACDYIFGETPTAKGAIAGSSKNKVWAIWTHRYYHHPDSKDPHNVLYILRLVIESDPTATRLLADAQLRPSKHIYDETLESLKAVLQAAQAEAAKWELDVVQIWDPTQLAKDLLAKSELDHVEVERQEEHIASLLWYDKHGEMGCKPPLWVNCEHYAWM
jgi:hypothetical protein